MPLTTYTAGEVLTAASLNANLSFAATNPVSKIVQVQTANLLTTASTSSSTFATTGLTVSITPTSATSTIFITAMVSCGYNSNTTAMALRLYRGTTAIAIPASAGSRVLATTQVTTNISESTNANMTYIDSPATTSATSYSVYFAALQNTAAAYINRSSNDTDNNTYARTISTITVFEVLA
jgi:hypothetical protein